MRLIDADALIEAVWHSGLGSRQDCVNLIKEMPTLPNPCGKPCAFERPRGEWKPDGTCSECGVYSSLNKDTAYFCPNCGSDNRKRGDKE